jgi:LacI family transcriptional regulator
MRVTIKDVANEAGVSVGTASYAINGTGPVSEEKLKRVQEAVKKLGYVPNGIARSLQAQSNGVVGYFAYSLAGPFFGQVMRGIEDTFNVTQEEMIACSCSSVKKKVTRFLRERMVDGAIIFGEHLEDDLITRIAGPNCPVVVMDRELTGAHISSVTIDNEKCAYEVGEYIHRLGFRNVGCVMGKGPDGIRRDRGFRRAVREFGLNLPEDWVLQGEFIYATAREQMLERLETATEIPEVIFAFNDEMAFGVMSALTERGYRIPEDVSVIGMDDLPQASFSIPKLTTYHQPIYEHGVQAAQTLQNMLRDSAHGTAVVLPGYMVERESCRRVTKNSEDLK